ncbi:hypothetical protein [Paenibacillus sp. V4I5]|uniref:hypothetical protein n=1 Tax=Paenibacillus sp. V4I5 TaxID=3042306 RepID=UPI00359450F9
MNILEPYKVFSGAELFYEYSNVDTVYNITASFTCREFTGELKVNSQEIGL